ncbi:hypothetical protein KDC22_13045 [Paenibacillus tritici]|nr:hypothetical protein [Paenibacillus tritici]QUL57307.1 hypothetical protein KDC22_13045 [Paenibacillus tritici]
MEYKEPHTGWWDCSPTGMGYFPGLKPESWLSQKAKVSGPRQFIIYKLDL